MYDFKRLDEFLWAIGIAAVVFILQLLADFDPSTVTDWETYLFTAGGGLARAVGAAGLIALQRIWKIRTEK